MLIQIRNEICFRGRFWHQMTELKRKTIVTENITSWESVSFSDTLQTQVLKGKYILGWVEEGDNNFPFISLH